MFQSAVIDLMLVIVTRRGFECLGLCLVHSHVGCKSVMWRVEKHVLML